MHAGLHGVGTHARAVLQSHAGSVQCGNHVCMAAWNPINVAPRRASCTGKLPHSVGPAHMRMPIRARPDAIARSCYARRFEFVCLCGPLLTSMLHTPRKRTR
eukprot:4695206-Lingulodinium_polyedra.AAC.1